VGVRLTLEPAGRPRRTRRDRIAELAGGKQRDDDDPHMINVVNGPAKTSEPPKSFPAVTRPPPS
jgi:hypothetical protein